MARHHRRRTAVAVNAQEREHVERREPRAQDQELAVAWQCGERGFVPCVDDSRVGRQRRDAEAWLQPGCEHDRARGQLAPVVEHDAIGLDPDRFAAHDAQRGGARAKCLREPLGHVGRVARARKERVRRGRDAGPPHEVVAVLGVDAHPRGRDIEAEHLVVAAVGDAAPEPRPFLDERDPQIAATSPQQMKREGDTGEAAADDHDLAAASVRRFIARERRAVRVQREQRIRVDVCQLMDELRLAPRHHVTRRPSSITRAQHGLGRASLQHAERAGRAIVAVQRAGLAGAPTRQAAAPSDPCGAPTC